jgi:CIC family chloride channel protein
MSALGSCIIGGPIANVLIIFELTSNYQAALSAGVCIVVATIVSSQLIGQSTFDQLLSNRQIDITVGRDILFLQRKKIKEIVDKNYLKIDGEIQVSQAIELFKQKQCSE